MRREISLSEGRAAAEELASNLLGFSVRKAIDPLTPAGFIMIGDRVAKRLAKAAQGQELTVLEGILEDLDLDWEKLSDAAREAAFKAIQDELSKSYLSKVVPVVEAVLLTEGPAFMRLVRLAMMAGEKLEIQANLTQRDLRAEQAIRTSHINYIKTSSGARSEVLSHKAREIVSNALAKGFGREHIVKQLKAEFSESVPRPDSYWSVVAESFIGRARVRSQIDAYVDADIKKYEFVAVLDEVTTDICRFMDGRVFSVSAARKLLDDIDSLKDPEDVRFAQPWVRKGIDDDGDQSLWVPNADGSRTTIAKIERSGVGKRDDRGSYTHSKSDAELLALGIPVPPLHGRCRSTIVAAEDG